jgi:hypothetical protein
MAANADPRLSSPDRPAAPRTLATAFLWGEDIRFDTARSKVCLVLCKERFESQKYISDFAGQDIAAHDNEPHVAVKAVRGFLSSHLHRSLLSPKVLWDRYTRFTKELAVLCAERSWTKTNSNFGKESIWRPNGLKRIHSCKRSTPPLASRTSMPVKLSRGL